MNVILRLTDSLLSRIREDLNRPHPFAAERVGFLQVGQGVAEDGITLVLGAQYYPVADEQYIDDPTVGACIDAIAIREARQRTLDLQMGCFHVHMHEGRGVPRMSRTDQRGIPPVIMSLRAVLPSAPHGILILSEDSCLALVWLPGASTPVVASQTSVIGKPTRIAPLTIPSKHIQARSSRQSFLGEDAQDILATVKVGIVGLGGGGSHIVQQLAHLGVQRYRIFDAQTIEDTNLNRLIGGVENDVVLDMQKTAIATRVIQGLWPAAEVRARTTRWQESPDDLRGCDIIFGCVDSYQERNQLEAVARRYLIPYIDIGMDIHRGADNHPRMVGQVLVSLPDGPCMRCLGFLTDSRLDEEGKRYGDTGSHPQVVWANGVLASTAVGLGIDILTGWNKVFATVPYYQYDGNAGTVTPHNRLKYLPLSECSHYPAHIVGAPIFRRR